MNKSFHYAKRLAKALDARLHFLNTRHVIVYRVPGLDVEPELALLVFQARYPNGVRVVLFSDIHTDSVFIPSAATK